MTTETGYTMQIQVPAQADVPHADVVEDIAETVRAIDALASGGGSASIKRIAERIGKSKRHAGYYANAARIWGCVDHAKRGEGWVPTPEGQQLAATRRGSSDERERILLGMRKTRFVEQVVFGPELAKDELTNIVMKAAFSELSAKRRVASLLQWRRYARDFSA